MRKEVERLKNHADFRPYGCQSLAALHANTIDDDLPRIIVRFEQVDAPDKRGFSGTGRAYDATTSPSATSRLIPASAAKSPNFLWRFRIETMAAISDPRAGNFFQDDRQE